MPLGADQWQQIAPGLYYDQQSIEGSQSSLHLLKIRLKQNRLGLLRAADSPRFGVEAGDGKRRARLKTLMANSPALAAINASFFTPEGQAMGLVIQNGVTLNPLRQTAWGIFQLVVGRPSIIHTSQYKSEAKRSLAIQSGPRLVIRGKTPQFRDSSIAPRSGVCVTKQGQVILAATHALITLQQFANALKAHCPNALNLDGGSSTQMYVKPIDLYLQGGEPVPNALAVFPK